MMCLSSLFKELWPFENSKMYRNVLKIHFFKWPEPPEKCIYRLETWLADAPLNSVKWPKN